MYDDYTAESEEYKGYTIKIEPDDYAPNPCKDFDMFGKMVCWHRCYNLGREQPSESPEDYLKQLAISCSPELENTIEYWENEGWERLTGLS